MSVYKSISIKGSAFIRRFRLAEEGEAAIGFGILLPVLVLVCLSILEFSLIVFDYHRASEATRRAARTVAISTPIPDPESLLVGGTITCAAAAGGVSCNGAAAMTPATFDAMIAEMQLILPVIQAANVEVEYSDIGLGDVTTPGGIIPLVTVRLVNLQHPFLMLKGFPGFGPSINYPAFTTNQVAGGLGVSDDS
ncbi:MAG: pilus assembly protein [Rhodospirillales bacterium]|nr:pilus assembly protein [Rhodospirillales bacterium]